MAELVYVSFVPFPILRRIVLYCDDDDDDSIDSMMIRFILLLQVSSLLLCLRRILMLRCILERFSLVRGAPRLLMMSLFVRLTPYVLTTHYSITAL